MANPIAVPSVKGVKGAFGDFAWGAAGGLIFILAYRLFGALGVIAAPLIAGAMIKGDRGSMISTMAGFLLFAMAVLGGSTSNGATSTSQEVM